jgi:hypothetical protein
LGYASDLFGREVALIFVRWLVAAYPHDLTLRILLIVVVWKFVNVVDVSSHFPCVLFLRRFILCTFGQLLLQLGPCYLLNRTKWIYPEVVPSYLSWEEVYYVDAHPPDSSPIDIGAGVRNIDYI